ncbi:hypothetical protein [Archangium lipolyticum]|uniref:hypothetical protein n=1 Tax=Archangium lipolyticum TaxID=2970465 RepID=UPI00214A808D|nr:hypothetical protein [Archangium lipolyticum]
MKLQPEPDSLPPDPKQREQQVHAAFEQQVDVAMRDSVDSAWSRRSKMRLLFDCDRSPEAR